MSTSPTELSARPPGRWRTRLLAAFVLAASALLILAAPAFAGDLLGDLTDPLTSGSEQESDDSGGLLGTVDEIVEPVTAAVDPVTEAVDEVIEPVTEAVEPVTQTVADVGEPVTDALPAVQAAAQVAIATPLDAVPVIRVAAAASTADGEVDLSVGVAAEPVRLDAGVTTDLATTDVSAAVDAGVGDAAVDATVDLDAPSVDVGVGTDVELVLPPRVTVPPALDGLVPPSSDSDTASEAPHDEAEASPWHSYGPIGKAIRAIERFVESTGGVGAASGLAMAAAALTFLALIPPAFIGRLLPASVIWRPMLVVLPPDPPG